MLYLKYLVDYDVLSSIVSDRYVVRIILTLKEKQKGDILNRLCIYHKLSSSSKTALRKMRNVKCGISRHNRTFSQK